MLRRLSAPALMGIGGLLISLLAAVPAVAAVAAPKWGTHICAGTAKQPGTLTGEHWNVVIHGVCAVNDGPAVVLHNLVISEGSALLAVFGRAHSRLWVGHDLIVDDGGTAFIGCEAKLLHGHPIFPCVDDPHQGMPTLSSRDVVLGSILADHALGMVVHNTWIGH